MTHNIQDIEDYHWGDALELNVTVTDSAGDAADLTDADATWYLMNQDTDDPETDALVTKDSAVAGEIEFTSVANGELTVKVETDDTTQEMVGNLHHRLRVTDVEGDRATVFTGRFEVLD